MKGILFKQEMFQAVVRKEDPKNQTRRIESSLEEINKNPDAWEKPTPSILGNGRPCWCFDSYPLLKFNYIATPRYQYGDIVYLKEPFSIQEFSYLFSIAIVNYRYESDHRQIDVSEVTAEALRKWKTSNNKWVSPLLMFSDFARYKIQITKVRCERLQDITPQDAIAEGIECIGEVLGIKQYKHYTHPSQDAGGWPVISYQSLWESIHGQDSWQKNPYLFAYDFILLP
jgi:hypothetical protein